MLTKKKKHEDAFLSDQDIILIGICALLIVLADMFVHFPIAVQGESGLIVTALLVLAVGIIRRPGVATLIAVIAGLIAALIEPSRWGFVYTMITFAVYGIGIDIGLIIMGSLDHTLVAIIVGSLSNLLHFAFKWIYGIIVDVPLSVVATAIPMTAIQHLIFGLLGGLIGFVLLFVFNAVLFRKTQIDS